LDVPVRGAINVHASLLPRYRGAAPIQRAILAGDTQTGITIMQMNERMDAGDILLQEVVPIHEDDTADTLGARLSAVGARLLVDTLDALTRGDVVQREQNEREATLAPMVRKEEGAIDWRRGAAEIARSVRAFSPWPGAYTKLAGRSMKIHRATPLVAAANAIPGTVLAAAGDRFEVATGEGLLALLEVQLEGKRRLTAREFLAGHSVRSGDRSVTAPGRAVIKPVALSRPRSCPRFQPTRRGGGGRDARGADWIHVDDGRSLRAEHHDRPLGRSIDPGPKFFDVHLMVENPDPHRSVRGRRRRPGGGSPRSVRRPRRPFTDSRARRQDVRGHQSGLTLDRRWLLAEIDTLLPSVP
jgi:methionyl-tRNA formyltransferase